MSREGLLRVIEWLNRLAKRHGIKLRQSFIRLATRARREDCRWMRTWPRRQTRDIRRQIAGDEALEAAFKVAFERAAQILWQHPSSGHKPYALHAPEVEFITARQAICLANLPRGGKGEPRWAPPVQDPWRTRPPATSSA